MNFGDFIAYVDDYINRDNISDRLPKFINMAKLRLQRKYDFNFTRTDQQFAYPAVAGSGVALPTNFKSMTGANSVRVISTGGIELPLKGSTLEDERRRAYATVVGVENASGVVTQATDINRNQALEIRAYVRTLNTGLFLFTTPEQLSATIKAEFYTWLSDYVVNTEEDFLLQRGYDCLLWETLSVANMFLYEENRVMIDAQAVAAAWQELTEWDKRYMQDGAFVEID